MGIVEWDCVKGKTGGLTNIVTFLERQSFQGHRVGKGLNPTSLNYA